MMSALFGGVWLLLLSVAGIVFRRRLARMLLHWTNEALPQTQRLRDLTIGIVLLCCFAAVMGASGVVMAVLGGQPSFPVIVVTLAAAVPLNFAYWYRFRRTGLGRVRRQG
ncbi:hypothetical protein ABH923_000568 [Leifsonia sp. EB41]|uniref:hypothetical protein n=1 Tax=Leifsonia sp. EB41 TaxID=3156260 RepID=UPI003512E49F